jgi:NAD(P)-dependent dehydrogenase (short-subunit alcohol dehydrogenase family)
MKPSFGLEGRVAVVTGAAGLLGPVWIEALLTAGAEVVALAKPGTENDRSLEHLHGGKLTVHGADVRDRGQLQHALMAVEHTYGTPHILVASAGVDSPPTEQSEPLDSVTPESIHQILDTNIVGTFLTLQLFGGAMAGAGRGSAIVIGSLYASLTPDPALYDHLKPPFLKPPMYGASKAAVVQLARHFATLWGAAGVRVNALSPGGVLGGQDREFIAKYARKTPLGRMADKRELAGPLLFLASDAASYVTGINLQVDGGFAQW